ncbi:PAC2 family protein [Candidatus Bathyarchaeota archaeon]|nr:PAC2 family protein [Candidatus Bathyarchaeota archaeon]MBS7617082.1 PAC2 family protein [Candidatus Bathyarchaeota archaeon]
MKSVEIKEFKQIRPRKPVLVAGFPGLGYIGKLAVTHMVNVLKAEKVAELYSPYFPYHVLCDEKGIVRLLRLEIYYWRSPEENGRDLLLLTGDAQPQSVEGGYIIVSEILNYFKGENVDTVIALGGYQSFSKNPTPVVVGASTNREMLEQLKNAGARVGGWGNPVVGLAGILVGLAEFYGLNGVCLLGETSGYVVDVKSTGEVLRVLSKLLNVEITLEGLKRDILKEIGEAISEVEAEMKTLEKMIDRMKGESITYIS